MGENWNRCGKVACLAAFTCLMGGMFAISCTHFEESGLPGSASSMARNRIMWVRKEPTTFGYYRLSSLERIYPDLALFLRKRGIPDYLAETDSNRGNYFILYYLRSRQAYAGRTRAGQQQSLEFAGPYPITKKEIRTLQTFREEDIRQ